jgi:prophage antirepressor-like protein
MSRILDRADVLRLIIGSTLSAAQRFERWVFEDVLSSITTIGSYISGQSATLAWLGSLRKSAG